MAWAFQSIWRRIGVLAEHSRVCKISSKLYIFATYNIFSGQAFGYSVWDGDVYLGFWEGDVTTERHSGTFRLKDTWKEGEGHIITVLQDHMGLEENWYELNLLMLLIT